MIKEKGKHKMNINAEKIIYYLYHQPDFETQIIDVKSRKHNTYITIIQKDYPETKTFKNIILNDICDSLTLDGVELNDVYDDFYEDVFGIVESVAIP